MPESKSLLVALQQVGNEVAQEAQKKYEEEKLKWSTAYELLKKHKDFWSTPVPAKGRDNKVKNTSGPATPEPMPIKGKEFVLPHVVNDLMQRDQLGKEKYGTSLETHNGRSSLWDAYQEALDFIIYFRKHLLEQEDKEDI